MLTPPESISKLVKPYLARAHELEQVNPAISYFCKLYAAQVILDQKLHLASEEVAEFISKLLDEIEEMKSSGDKEFLQLINDKDKSMELVKSFAFDVFDNLNQQVENKVANKATALGFIASVNFLTLLRIWQPEDGSSELSVDISQRIKYAKFHAARILKSIRKGEDPNEYELKGQEDVINKLEKQLGVESQESNLAQSSAQSDESVANTGAVPHLPDVPESNEAEEVNQGEIKSAPSDIDQEGLPFKLPSVPQPERVKKSEIRPAPAKPVKDAQKPDSQSAQKPAPQPVQRPVEEPITKEKLETILQETEVIALAQKHAKYAISALNYEDKKTAIKELQAALKLLE